MAKAVVYLAVIVAIVLVAGLALSAAFAWGFNVFTEPFNLPVIGWEEGVGAIIMASVVGVFVGGTSAAGKR